MSGHLFSVRLSLIFWGYSSAGRAPALQAGGQRFDPAYLHHSLIEVVSILVSVGSNLVDQRAKFNLWEHSSAG